MAAGLSAPDHRRTDRTGRSRPKGVEMHATTVKRTIATALAGAAIASAIGAPAASAMPANDVRPSQPRDVRVVAPPQHSTAPAADDTTPDAGFDLSSAAIGAATGGGLVAVFFAASGMAGARPMTWGHRAAGA
jgi:hypothetical protein